MPDITIPPAALQAGRKELKVYFSGYQDYAVQEIARAAFLAMVKAWPNGNLHVPVGAGEPRKSLTLPALILPITETSTKENNNG